MKNKPTSIKRSNNMVAKGLFSLSATWAAIFSPVIIVILGYIIPFGDASTRSYILKLMSSDFGRIFLFLMISLPIWYGLKQILVILHKFNIYPKREKLLTYGLALAWTAHTIYILFVRI